MPDRVKPAPNRAARRAAEKYRRRMNMPVNAANFTPEQKMQFVEDQIRARTAAQRDFLLCPYCGGENWPAGSGEMCCDLFRQAVVAVLERMEKQDEVRATLEFMGEVADKNMQALQEKKPWLH
jgi:hypothetical protein